MSKRGFSRTSHSSKKAVQRAENAAEAEAEKSASDGAGVVAVSQAGATKPDKPSGVTPSASLQEGTSQDQTPCAGVTEPDTAECPRQDGADAGIEEAAAASSASVSHTPHSCRAVLQPQDQPSEGAAEGHAETLDPSTVESRGQSAAQSLNVSEEQREAAEYLAHFFKRWQEESSPAGQRRQLKQEMTGDIRTQLDRLRHAFQAELDRANARGDYQATQIIHCTLIRLIQGEKELGECVEKWTDGWMPNPGRAYRKGEFVKSLATAPSKDPLACIRLFRDAELELFVREHVASEKASQSEVLRKKKGRKVGWGAATHTRNKWIYEECMKGTVYSTIIRRLSRKPTKWPRIKSVSGIKKVATAYATRHALPVPPKRQSGRRSR